MAYGADYIEELDPYSKLEDELQAVSLGLNIVDVTEFPPGALDTQHFGANAVGIAKTTSATADFVIAEPSAIYVDTWPPPGMTGFDEMLRLTAVNWDPTGEYTMLHVRFNGNMASVANTPASGEVYAVAAIAVKQGGTFRIVPKTVRPYSIKDRRIDSTDDSNIDIALATWLSSDRLPSAGVVTEVAAVMAIHDGSGTTEVTLSSMNLFCKSVKAGDLSG